MTVKTTAVTVGKKGVMVTKSSDGNEKLRYMIREVKTTLHSTLHSKRDPHTGEIHSKRSDGKGKKGVTVKAKGVMVRKRSDGNEKLRYMIRDMIGKEAKRDTVRYTVRGISIQGARKTDTPVEVPKTTLHTTLHTKTQCAREKAKRGEICRKTQ